MKTPFDITLQVRINSQRPEHYYEEFAVSVYGPDSPSYMVESFNISDGMNDEKNISCKEWIANNIYLWIREFLENPEK